MTKIKKGERGYIRSQQVLRTVTTVILFAICLLLYFTGIAQTGTRLNWFTIIAVLGCLPAAKSAVSMIMILMQHPMKAEDYDKVKDLAKNGIMLYEMCFTAYEKTTQIDCVYIKGGCVIGYASGPKADPAFIEKHLKGVLKTANRNRTVKVFKDLKPFMDRVRALDKAEESEQLAEKNLEVKATLQAVAL